MPNDFRSTRRLLRPTKGFPQREIPSYRLPKGTWYRIHRSDRSALEFGLKPFHRFSHPDCPHPVLYLGSSVSTCLWEVFGDDVFQNERAIALSRWGCYSLSAIKVPKVNLCALDTEQTRSAAGVDKGSLLAANLHIPQAWGLAIQKHPAGFQGIQYTSRFSDHTCLALFELPEIVRGLKSKSLGPVGNHKTAIDWLDHQKVVLV